MRHAPNYFEHNAGQPQLHVPEASKDTIEFTPEPQTIVVEKTWDEMTEEEREAMLKLF